MILQVAVNVVQGDHGAATDSRAVQPEAIQVIGLQRTARATKRQLTFA